MKKILSLFGRILFILPYLIVFVYSLYQPSDPDLGWHLKYGEYFWLHASLLRDNTFSTMMPDFHWANTSWLTDIISYTVYHFGGLFGITLLGALVVTLTYYFFAKAFTLTLWQQTIIFPFVLYLEDPVNAISFRGQQLSLLFGGILFYLISLYAKKPRLLWLIVPLFLIWVDVDGEFLLGYALFGLWVVLFVVTLLWKKVFTHDVYKGKLQNRWKFYFKKFKTAFAQEKKEIVMLFGILLAAFLTTFLNPFGYGLHLDALHTIGSPLLKDISEYQPFLYLSSDWWNELIVGIILVFGLFILGFRGKSLETLPILGGGLLLFILSLQVRRYAWPAYYLLFPLLAMVATFLKPDSKKMTKIATAVLLPIFLICIVMLRYPFVKYTNFDWNGYCRIQADTCSPQSARFLIDHHLNHNIFSLYGWGGWLIWNYPQIKPTIDGRMHMWVQNGYSGFSDYYAVEQNFKDIDKTPYSVAYTSLDKPVYNRLSELTKEGKWKEVYQDTISAIFVRKD